MEQPKPVILSNGKTAVGWSQKEKPCINHWYLCIGESDYWKIQKDYYSKEQNVTYYKIVEYNNGDVLYCGRSLAVILQLIRENTYRMVI